jgi:hypothetical protein
MERIYDFSILADSSGIKWDVSLMYTTTITITTMMRLAQFVPLIPRGKRVHLYSTGEESYSHKFEIRDEWYPALYLNESLQPEVDALI